MSGVAYEVDSEVGGGEGAGDAFADFPDGEPGQRSCEFKVVWGEYLVSLGEDFAGSDGVGVDTAARFFERGIVGLASLSDFSSAGCIELGV